MPLSPNVRNAFDQWISVSTWHTGHPLDERRFYKFVWTVYEFSRKRPSEQELRAEIVAFWTDQLQAEYLLLKARAYAGLYESLYEFARARKRRY